MFVAPKVVRMGEPNYLEKEDYGKVPAYLSKVKEEIRRENEMIDRYVKERLGVTEQDPEKLEELDEHERLELIEKLKAKWEATNAQYQKMTHLVKLDSYGKVRRKEELETLLKQLEGDIEKLEKHGPVYVRG